MLPAATVAEPDVKYIARRLPDEICGTHFGPTLTAFVLYQYYGCHVTQPLIAEQLKELGIEISTGQISNIITHNKNRFHSFHVPMAGARRSTAMSSVSTAEILKYLPAFAIVVESFTTAGNQK